MPSNYLILCCPLFCPSSVFPNIRVFCNESAVCIRWPKQYLIQLNQNLRNYHDGFDCNFYFLYGVAVIKETGWRCTQDLYVGRSLKARGFKTTTNSLENVFIVDAKEQSGDMIWPRHGSKGRCPPGAADKKKLLLLLPFLRTGPRPDSALSKVNGERA